jgi:hypothetical protein
LTQQVIALDAPDRMGAAFADIQALCWPANSKPLQYFAETTIDKVTDAKLADYVDWGLSQPRRPAIVTLKNERTAIRQLLRCAKRRGYITEVISHGLLREASQAGWTHRRSHNL